MTAVLAETIRRFESRDAHIAVVGAGQVGLTVATAFASAGFSVVAIDRDPAIVAAIAGGIAPRSEGEPELPARVAELVAAGRLRATSDVAEIASSDAVIVCVDTPVADGKPDLSRVTSAIGVVGAHLRAGALVVVESTLPPGTTSGVVVPALEAASGRRAGETFFVGHCPERVMTGKLLRNLRTMPRACGGTTPETARAMVALYTHVVDAELTPCDAATAEIVKTAENAWRDVTIAFANEVARVCEQGGADFRQVRALVNACPERAMPWAGGGVGGPCIPKDTWLLASASPGGELLRAARAINDGMPVHVADLVTDALARRGVVSGRAGQGAARVVILGLAYLPDCGDLRGSPSLVLADVLAARGIQVLRHDPHVAGEDGDPFAIARDADALVLMVAHEAYRELPLARLAAAMRTPVLVDARHFVDAPSARAAGFDLVALGRGPVQS